MEGRDSREGAARTAARDDSAQGPRLGGSTCEPASSWTPSLILADVPRGWVTHIKSEKVWKQSCDEWDKRYPGNPVQGEQEADDEQNAGSE